MAAVLEAVYGAYVIDWATTGPQARPLPSEALQLAEVLTGWCPMIRRRTGWPRSSSSPRRAPRPAWTRTGGSSRCPSRTRRGGTRELIDRAHEHLRAAHARGRLGRFQLEAAIQAVHCARRQAGTTDWPTLLTLHRLLHAIAPSLGSGVALAAVTAEVEGPRPAGRARRTARTTAARARRFQPARATRAHLLDRLGRSAEAGRLRQRDRSDPRHRRTPVPPTAPRRRPPPRSVRASDR